MGFGSSSSGGAKIANQAQGSGSLRWRWWLEMTNQEMAILNIYKIQIKIIMLNNHSLGGSPVAGSFL